MNHEFFAYHAMAHALGAGNYSGRNRAEWSSVRAAMPSETGSATASLAMREKISAKIGAMSFIGSSWSKLVRKARASCCASK
jgi:hypothetical protein